MNPDCPCERTGVIDGLIHRQDAGVCWRCWTRAKHLPDCECAVNIASAFADAKDLMERLERAMLKQVEAEGG